MFAPHDLPSLPAIAVHVPALPVHSWHSGHEELTQQCEPTQFPLVHWMLLVQLPLPFGIQLPPLQ
jgi:hypothetical protein